MTTSIDYPSSLPPPITAGYEIDDMPVALRDDTDAGLARQRLRTTSLRTEFPITFKFTQWQLMVFEGWLRWKVAYTAWFNIDIEGAVGLVSHEARFKLDQPPKAPRQQGGFYYVQAVLEAVERPMLTESDLDLLSGEDGDALLGAINALNLYVTTSKMWGT